MAPSLRAARRAVRRATAWASSPSMGRGRGGDRRRVHGVGGGAAVGTSSSALGDGPRDLRLDVALPAHR
ncbi:MAG: hypothetical protein R3B82_26720 [Sandaracinaceae bacterium]